MRTLIFGAALLLAACAGGESTEITRAPPPPPSAAAAPVTPAPPPAATGPSAAAPGVTLPAEPAPPVRSGDITVPGGREIPAPTPSSDTRTNEQRAQDIRAWDNCVMRLQNRAEDNPTRPALTSPEEVCSRSLGMSSRTSVPDSRRD